MGHLSNPSLWGSFILIILLAPAKSSPTLDLGFSGSDDVSLGGNDIGIDASLAASKSLHLGNAPITNIAPVANQRPNIIIFDAPSTTVRPIVIIRDPPQPQFQARPPPPPPPQPCAHPGPQPHYAPASRHYREVNQTAGAQNATTKNADGTAGDHHKSARNAPSPVSYDPVSQYVAGSSGSPSSYSQQQQDQQGNYQHARNAPNDNVYDPINPHESPSLYSQQNQDQQQQQQQGNYQNTRNVNYEPANQYNSGSQSENLQQQGYQHARNAPSSGNYNSAYQNVAGSPSGYSQQQQQQQQQHYQQARNVPAPSDDDDFDDNGDILSTRSTPETQQQLPNAQNQTQVKISTVKRDTQYNLRGNQDQQGYHTQQGSDSQQGYQQHGYQNQQGNQGHQGYQAQRSYQTQQGYDNQQAYQAQQGHQGQQDYEAQQGHQGQQDHHQYQRGIRDSDATAVNANKTSSNSTVKIQADPIPQIHTQFRREMPFVPALTTPNATANKTGSNESAKDQGHGAHEVFLIPEGHEQKPRLLFLEQRGIEGGPPGAQITAQNNSSKSGNETSINRPVSPRLSGMANMYHRVFGGARK